MRDNIRKIGDELIGEVGTSPSRTYLPGLRSDQIEAVLHGTALVFGPELYALYFWRNGQCAGENVGEGWLVFGIYAFLPLEVAVERALDLPAMLGDWKNTWLPLLSNEAGDYYFCDCSESGEESPVYRYRMYSESQDRAEPAFPSVEALLSACLDSVRRGQKRPD